MQYAIVFYICFGYIWGMEKIYLIVWLILIVWAVLAFLYGLFIIGYGLLMSAFIIIIVDFIATLFDID